MSDETYDLSKLEVAYNPITEKTVLTKTKAATMTKWEKGDLLTDEFLLACFEKAGGNVTRAAQLAGCTRRLYYKRAANVEGFRELMHDIRESKIDIAEDKLWEHIEMGNPHAIMFYLRTIGKHRGYTTATDVNIDGKAEIKININVGKPEDYLEGEVITIEDYD